MLLGVWHTSWTVADLDRSVAFYRDLLGFELVETKHRIGSFIESVVGFSGAELGAGALHDREAGLTLVEAAGTEPLSGAGSDAVSAPTTEIAGAHTWLVRFASGDAAKHDVVDARELERATRGRHPAQLQRRGLGRGRQRVLEQ